jgi:replicative DNA helicase Mcm
MKPVMDICDSISMLHTPTLLKKGIWSTIHDYKSGVRRPSKVQLQKIKNRLCGLVDKDLVKRLGTLAARDYFLDELISVTEEEYHGYVYDLYVPSHHNFVSDGVLVHNCIDELDKMSEQDSSAMHEAMEQQQISVAKAGITATLQSRCAILAAANPKEGRFDEHSYLVDQINLAPTLLSRFDVIFPLTDKPDKVRDAALAAHITNTHLAGEIAQYRKNVQDRRYSAEDELEVMQKVEPIYKPAFLRKYIAYAKSRIFPVMTKDTMEVIREYYVNIRAQSKATEGEGGAVPMTPRQVEALIRLSEASARVRLSNKVTTEDAERAKKIVEYFLRKVASEGGRLDIDAIMTGTTHSQRERIHSILDIVEELDEGRGVTEEEILRRMSQDGVPDEKVRRDLERLHNEGRLFNPTSGRFKVARERR